MTLTKRRKIEPILSWCMAMLLCPLGVCFTVKSAFGVSMIEAPVYVIHLKLSEYWPWYTFGTSEYFVQAAVLLVMCLFIRKFKWSYLLSFATAFLFGLILDGWNLVFRWLTAEGLAPRILLLAVGFLLSTLAVSMFFRTWLPLEAWELFVKEVSDHFRWDITYVKWACDMIFLGLGILLPLLFFGSFRWDAVGVGTIVTALINAPVIRTFTKIQDRIWNRLTARKAE